MQYDKHPATMLFCWTKQKQACAALHHAISTQLSNLSEKLSNLQDRAILPKRLAGQRLTPHPMSITQTLVTSQARCILWHQKSSPQLHSNSSSSGAVVTSTMRMMTALLRVLQPPKNRNACQDDRNACQDSAFSELSLSTTTTTHAKTLPFLSLGAALVLQPLDNITHAKTLLSRVASTFDFSVLICRCLLRQGRGHQG